MSRHSEAATATPAERKRETPNITTTQLNTSSQRQAETQEQPVQGTDLKVRERKEEEEGGWRKEEEEGGEEDPGDELIG